MAVILLFGGMLCLITGCAQITNLGAVVPGAPAAGAVSEAFAINNSAQPGTIVGVFRDATGFDRGVVWQRNGAGAWTGTSIGTLQGPVSSANQAFISQARAISEETGSPGRAFVAGFSSDLVILNSNGSATPVESIHGAVFSVRDSSLANLNTFSSAFNPDGFVGDSQALGITKTPSLSLIYTVGWVGKSAGNRHANLVCLSYPDCAKDLGTLATALDKADSQANALNSKREIVGSSTTANGETHAAFWFSDPHDGETVPCPVLFIRDIGPAGLHSEALAINDQTQIVGYVVKADGVENAAVFSSTSPLGMTTLPNPGGRNSRALGINGVGTIVGWAEDSAGNRHAVVWRNNVMTDLNANSAEGVIAAFGGPNWVLLEARGINDGGAIVGVGLRNGEKRAFLLEPKKWPTP